jgi:CRISPR/Cas system-associated endoribonuclease Cas2
MEYLLTAPWSASQLIDNFFEGRIAIPEIQRDLVWSSDQVKSLLDSIYQSYPCGSLILWEPRTHDAKLMREIIRPERLEYYQGKLPRYFLIDGQQRVTALASVMLNPGFLSEVEPEIENDPGSLYVNIKKFPKEVQAAADEEPYKFPWVSMNDVFTGRLKELPEFQKLTYEQKRAIDRDVQRIRDYTFPVQIIQERNYAKVGKIFTLVSSQGDSIDDGVGQPKWY